MRRVLSPDFIVLSLFAETFFFSRKNYSLFSKLDLPLTGRKPETYAVKERKPRCSCFLNLKSIYFCVIKQPAYAYPRIFRFHSLLRSAHQRFFCTKSRTSVLDVVRHWLCPADHFHFYSLVSPGSKRGKPCARSFSFFQQESLRRTVLISYLRRT